MTTDELKAKVPEKLRPWVDSYGPALLAMSGEELKAWLDRLVRGDLEAAYTSILARMENSELMDEWTGLESQWKSANETNAQKLDLQRSALAALMKVLLAIALAGVGL